MITHQKGIYTVEFAIVGSVFLVTLLSIIQLGLTLMTWNALSEATRRGARVAAVCPINDAAIKNIAMFNNATGSGGGVVPGLSANDLDLAYLDSSGNPVDTAAADFLTVGYLTITFVRVAINNNYSFPTVLPWMQALSKPPSFSTSIPRESLGVSRTSTLKAFCLY